MSLKRERLVFNDEHPGGIGRTTYDRDASFQEYADLWRTFIGLLPFMCIRNMPTPTVWIPERDGPTPIPQPVQRVKRIETLILELEEQHASAGNLQTIIAQRNRYSEELNKATAAENQSYTFYLDKERERQAAVQADNTLSTGTTKAAVAAAVLAVERADKAHGVAALKAKKTRDLLIAKQQELDVLNAADLSNARYTKKLVELKEYEQAQIDLWNYMSTTIYLLSVNSYVERRLAGTTYELKHVALLNVIQQHPSTYDALDHPLLVENDAYDSQQADTTSKRHMKVGNPQRQSYIDGLMGMIAP